MKNKYSIIPFVFITSLAGVLLAAFKDKGSAEKPAYSFPYKAAGLTERQAAAHLISRFSFGATPGMIEDVVKTGLENWFARQLKTGLQDLKVDSLLQNYPSLTMSNEEIAQLYPDKKELLKAAVDDGVINKDSTLKSPNEIAKAYRFELMQYMADKGLKPRSELFDELISQKILRAAYSNNQLQEVMTDFWFNHFNISLSKQDCARFATSYEQKAIRPNTLGKFETLLLATAKSPAMLSYLDNSKSMASREDATELQKRRQDRFSQAVEDRQMSDSDMQKMDVAGKLKKANKAKGLNENYAREIMELHTLGVDGGYTQSDVTQAAKVLTGWSIFPIKKFGGKDAGKFIENMDQARFERQGFVHEGDFLFYANRHDKTAKTVLGNQFAAGGGYDEGLQLIHILSHHASAAKFICRKLAIRFVSDNPPQTLVDKMTKTFLEKDGDIRQVLITMVSAPEFWAKDAVREKTKSPFELVISSVRSLNAQVNKPLALFKLMDKMGEKIYYYQAPTGFPDQGKYWINTGSLLNRMNFGLALATQRIPGVKLDLLALNNNHEPESPEAALATYAKLMMPERNMDETIKRLTPLLSNPELIKKVGEAANKTLAQKPIMAEAEDETMTDADVSGPGKQRVEKLSAKKSESISTDKMMQSKENDYMLAQVVGIILGSPEFQRR